MLESIFRLQHKFWHKCFPKDFPKFFGTDFAEHFWVTSSKNSKHRLCDLHFSAFERNTENCGQFMISQLKFNKQKGRTEKLHFFTEIYVLLQISLISSWICLTDYNSRDIISDYNVSHLFFGALILALNRTKNYMYKKPSLVDKKKFSADFSNFPINSYYGFDICSATCLNILFLFHWSYNH